MHENLRNDTIMNIKSFMINKWCWLHLHNGYSYQPTMGLDIFSSNLGTQAYNTPVCTEDLKE